MRMRVISYILISFIITIIICSCDNQPIVNDKDIVFPDSNVSYQNHVQPFMMLKCAYRGCHSSEDRAGGRDMTTWFALFETENVGLVIPYNPEQSRFVQILKASPPHQGYFTFQKGYFSENHINGIITWINEGAELN